MFWKSRLLFWVLYIYHHLANANKPDLNSLPSLFVYLSRIVSTFHFHFGPQPALFCVVKVRMIGAKHNKIQSTGYILYVKDSDV